MKPKKRRRTLRTSRADVRVEVIGPRWLPSAERRARSARPVDCPCDWCAATPHRKRR